MKRQPAYAWAASKKVTVRPTGSLPGRWQRAVQEETLPLVDALQAMQRHVVSELADDQVGQQTWPRQPLGNGHRRLGRRDHHLAGVRELAR